MDYNALLYGKHNIIQSFQGRSINILESLIKNSFVLYHLLMDIYVMMSLKIGNNSKMEFYEITHSFIS